MDCSIIVVSHNSSAVLEDCLKHIAEAYPEAELIVVDTGSSDGSPEMVRALFSQAKLLAVPNNGYAFAVNRGLEVATQAWLVQMNSDVYVKPGDLETLQAALEAHPKAAFAGPLLVNQNSKRQTFGWFSVGLGKLSKPKAVSWVSGAIMMVRREAYERFGGMDERFFFYNEDLEWCWRARREGWQCLLVPHNMLHLGGSSTPADPRFMAEGYRGGLLISREYLPLYHGLHKKAVWLEAWLRSRFDPNPVQAEGYRQVLAMLEQGSLDISAFRA